MVLHKPYALNKSYHELLKESLGITNSIWWSATTVHNLDTADIKNILDEIVLIEARIDRNDYRYYYGFIHGENIYFVRNHNVDFCLCGSARHKAPKKDREVHNHWDSVTFIKPLQG